MLTMWWWGAPSVLRDIRKWAPVSPVAPGDALFPRNSLGCGYGVSRGNGFTDGYVDDGAHNGYSEELPC